MKRWYKKLVKLYLKRARADRNERILFLARTLLQELQAAGYDTKEEKPLDHYIGIFVYGPSIIREQSVVVICNYKNHWEVKGPLHDDDV